MGQKIGLVRENVWDSKIFEIINLLFLEYVSNGFSFLLYQTWAGSTKCQQIYEIVSSQMRYI